VSTYEWLLALHITGAFLLLGGSIVAATFNVLARRRERPSEVALFLGLIRIGVVAIWAGSLLTIVIGLWLVHHVGYSYGEFWVWASVLLWIVGNALGGAGGKRLGEAQTLAQRQAADGDAPSRELTAAVRDPRASALFWGSGAAIILVLVLMIWKPGA
jgi:uncharacterized membrane protein